jgi:hypothetical protein
MHRSCFQFLCGGVDSASYRTRVPTTLRNETRRRRALSPSFARETERPTRVRKTNGKWPRYFPRRSAPWRGTGGAPTRARTPRFCPSQKTPLGSEDGDAAREENAAAASACELAVAAARTIPEPFGQSDRVPDGHERAVESAHEIASLLHEWRAKVLEDTGTLPPGFVRCTSRYVGALVRKRLGEVTREEAILRKDLATLDVGTEEQTTI